MTRPPGDPAAMMPEDDGSSHRKPPAALDAERALLGTVLTDNTVIADVGHILTPEDFYMAKHGHIWRVMQKLWGDRQPIDITTVREALSDSTIDSVILTDLIAGQHVAAHAASYAAKVKNQSNRRKLIAAAGLIAAAAYEETDSQTAQQRATATLFEAVDQLEEDERVLTPMQQAHLLVRTYEEMAEGTSPAVATGFQSLDKFLWGGLRPGDLVVVSGRTTAGKSSYAECISENIANAKHSVIYFNLEMSPKKMLQRFARRAGTLSESALQFGPTHDQDIERLHELGEKRSKMPITLINDAASTSSSIRAMVSSHVMRNGPVALIVVDYLQLLSDRESKSGSEPQRIAKITRAMKLLAREFNCAVILISQLNRNVEYRGGEPQLHDLAQSGAIENDADIVLMLWFADDDSEERKLKIAKSRDGQTTELPIFFYGPSFLFQDGVRDDSQNAPTSGTIDA